MALFEIKMPKLGESITQATIIRWFVKEGDYVKEDDVLLDIATDKVDSEIPSPVAGTVKKIFYQENAIVQVGEVIAIIDTEANSSGKNKNIDEKNSGLQQTEKNQLEEKNLNTSDEIIKPDKKEASARFYSPLAKLIARRENISAEELEKIPGSGINGRVQKKDILAYLEKRKVASATSASVVNDHTPVKSEALKYSMPVYQEDEIIEMDRIRKITAEHMIRSKQTSAHVTNILEADVTAIVNWRNKIKDEFEKREGIKLTYLPLIIEAVIKSLKEFPMLNSSVDGNRIILKKRINIGIAVALPDSNLIVPVIKNADYLNITGLAKEINRLAENARKNDLLPDDVNDGTFTVTNFGTFRNTIGTPIINQPQVAILGIGTVEKKPSVLETPDGDVIAIRHKMFLSLTYDHRIINGAYAGSYLRRLADYLETFDTERTI
ncbi:MAG TPA: dihydrolipoamide acetyltransferase family protein [Bacteroidales bacterium]|nr:dihydrolipoamide acetyltransferase family protein [Bacteroidales bacterium]HOM39536.1 dihydrolipoamide acetyltransferase family protein [Bacteroidales bacterium]HOU31110.1 dihydrolipoamide acetyltransferase family protein [Bacteroidales bacterium]HQG55391.1 dihydrolipoamide acetyltransferase family protein [Bacteroidales bacterium]HQK71749.1 dihydrolipoamide acetyltransferase family protein [Bacteroidales bacterium]